MQSAEPVVAPRRRVPLAPLTTFGIGGPAAWLQDVWTVEQVEAAHRWARERDLPLVILGGGSNLVIADEGVNALVVRVTIGGLKFVSRGGDTIVRAGAGERWDDVVRAAVDRGLAGIECLSGIPGSVGGTPVQNVGAYGQEVAETLVEVVAFDRQHTRVVAITAADCRFAYRMSRFKQEDVGRFIICSVTFRLRSGPPTVAYPDIIEAIERSGQRHPSVRDVRDAVMAVRRRKGMVIDPQDPDTRSVGSFFTNPVVSAAKHAELVAECSGQRVPGFAQPDGSVKVPAAWLIERAGFRRGFGVGAAGLSSKHPLAIVNRGGASARDVLRLASRIKRQVYDRFGIALRPEPVFVGFRSDPEVEYLLSSGTP